LFANGDEGAKWDMGGRPNGDLDDRGSGSDLLQKEGFYYSLGRSLLDAVDFTGVVVGLDGYQIGGRWSKSMKKE
jgi:hypothetical protein